MVADRCWKIISSPQPTPTPPTPVDGDTNESRSKNRRMQREYREDVKDYEQKTGMAAAIIRSTLTPAAETYVKGMSDSVLMWTTLRDRLSPRQKPAHQHTLRTEMGSIPGMQRKANERKSRG